MSITYLQANDLAHILCSSDPVLPASGYLQHAVGRRRAEFLEEGRVRRVCVRKEPLLAGAPHRHIHPSPPPPNSATGKTTTQCCVIGELTGTNYSGLVTFHLMIHALVKFPWAIGGHDTRICNRWASWDNQAGNMLTIRQDDSTIDHPIAFG